MDYKEYRGETTNKWWNIYDCEKCSYVGTKKIFDKQPQARKSFIAVILGLSAFSMFRTNRRKKKVSSAVSVSLTNHEIKKYSWYAKNRNQAMGNKHKLITAN